MSNGKDSSYAVLVSTIEYVYGFMEGVQTYKESICSNYYHAVLAKDLSCHVIIQEFACAQLE